MEGKNHTARKGVLSGVGKTPQPSFDVRSWQGLTEVLKRARESGLPDEEYASFRDTVLEYAQSGGEESLRTKIEETIAQFDDVPVQTPSAEKIVQTPQKIEVKEVTAVNEVVAESPLPTPIVATRNTFNSPRPKPEFKAPTPKPQTTSAPVPGPTSKEPPALVRNVPVTEAVVPPNLPTSGVMPKMQEEAAQVEVEKAVLPNPVPEVNTPEAPPSLPSAASPEPEVRKEVVPELDIAKAKARIAEIKHVVNVQVGNPGTLIDDGNTIGKDYMSALLAAMKASAGGESGSLEIAMAKLEKSYELVMQFAERLKKEEVPPTPITKSTPPPAPAPAPPPTVVPESEPRKIEEVSQASGQVNGKKNQQTTSVVTPKTVEEFEKKKKASFAALKERVAASKIEKEEEQKAANQHENVMAGASAPSDISAAAPNEARKDEETEPPAAMPPVPPPAPNKESAGAAPQTPMQSSIPSLADRLKGMVPSVSKAVAKDSPYSDQPPSLQKLGKNSAHLSAQVSSKNAPPPAPLPNLTNPVARNENTPSVPDGMGEAQNVREIQDDLYAEKVTQSLEQLLDEWDLFGKSGFMGMGPSGIHHPLYQQLSQLTMFSVTSGRFEGATPDTRQSLMDYINAWRYEQGVSFSPTETFEHYLRRVLARIIRRQGG